MSTPNYLIVLAPLLAVSKDAATFRYLVRSIQRITRNATNDELTAIFNGIDPKASEGVTAAYLLGSRKDSLGQPAGDRFFDTAQAFLFASCAQAGVSYEGTLEGALAAPGQLLEALGIEDALQETLSGVLVKFTSTTGIAANRIADAIFMPGWDPDVADDLSDIRQIASYWDAAGNYVQAVDGTSGRVQ